MAIIAPNIQLIEDVFEAPNSDTDPLGYIVEGFTRLGIIFDWKEAGDVHKKWFVSLYSEAWPETLYYEHQVEITTCSDPANFDCFSARGDKTGSPHQMFSWEISDNRDYVSIAMQICYKHDNGHPYYFSLRK